MVLQNYTIKAFKDKHKTNIQKVKTIIFDSYDYEIHWLFLYGSDTIIICTQMYNNYTVITNLED